MQFTGLLFNLSCSAYSLRLAADTPTNIPPSESVTGSVLQFLISGCTTSTGQGCTATVINLPYTAHWQGTIGGEAGTSTLTIADATGIGFKLHCEKTEKSATRSCTITWKEMALHQENGTPTTITGAKEIKVSESAGFCAFFSQLHVGSAEITIPHGFTVL